MYFRKGARKTKRLFIILMTFLLDRSASREKIPKLCWDIEIVIELVVTAAEDGSAKVFPRSRRSRTGTRRFAFSFLSALPARFFRISPLSARLAFF